MISEALAACGIHKGETYQLASILDKRIQCLSTASRKEGATWAKAQGALGRNVYLCGNPVRPDLGPNRAGAADVVRQGCLLVDIDPDPDGAALKVAEQVWGLVGGALVDSGRGAQVWLQVEPDVDRRGLLLALKARFSVPGVKFDSTYDPSRLMRLPGTINRKTGRVACLIKTS